VYFAPLLRYSALNNGVTLKSWSRVVQDHWKWHHSKACTWFPIRLS